MKDPVAVALAYKHKYGFCIIPVKGKVPLVDWKDYQDEQPSDETIRHWWKEWPRAGIAVVTGKVSGGVCVLDTDDYKKGCEVARLDSFIRKDTKMPVSRTPRGGFHKWFHSEEELGDKIGFIKGCDFRSGGIIILPYSEGYIWKVKLSEVEIPKLPDALIKFLKSYSNKPVALPPAIGTSTVAVEYFSDGRRDNDLFSVANALIKNDLDPAFARATLDRIIRGWDNVIQNCAELKVQSAVKRHSDTTLVEDVRTWVESANGIFESARVCMDLEVKSKVNKKSLSSIFSRMLKEGIIERVGTKHGTFRKIDNNRDVIPWQDVEPFEYYDIKMPLGLHDLCNIKKTNIIVMAGTSNAGKTAFALNVALMNKQHKVRYLCSEMDETELAERIAYFGRPKDAWNHVEFSRLKDGGADAIDGDGLNIIDYIEPVDGEFYKMQTLINDAHSKLKNGICYINIQKKPGEIYGKGGSGTVERARLYMSMEYQELKLVKVKSPKKQFGITKDLEGMKISFKLHKQSTFYEQERN
jgi:hypothetical protein